MDHSFEAIGVSNKETIMETKNICCLALSAP